MSYIDLINRFWKVHEGYSFSAVEIGLYFKLLDIANKMRWEKERLYIPMIRLQTEMDACKSSILKARKRLEEADLIVVQSGHGNRQAAGYQIIGVEAKSINETDCVPTHDHTDNHKDDRTDDHTRSPYIRLDKDKDQEIDTDQMKMMIHDHSGDEVSQDKDEVVVNAEEIVQLFNLVCTSLKKAQSSPTIREKLNQRAKDFKTKEQWATYFRKVAQSPFLCGHNQYGWQADLFWLIKDEDTPHRILEGKYDKCEHGKGANNVVAMNPLENYDPVRGACYTNADFGNDNHLVDELAQVGSS
ncbi:MAG TPA: hypothetical protein P5107_10250 [Thermotogota bacterium]|nr:hypothetical protein [Thermotogota bacterium]